MPDSVVGVFLGKSYIDPRPAVFHDVSRFHRVDGVDQRGCNELPKIVLGETHQLAITHHCDGGIAGGVGE